MKKISVLSLLFIFSVSVLSAGSSIVGSMNRWDPADPAYDLSINANGVWQLTKTLSADSYEYKVVEGDDWIAPNYPGNDQPFTLGSEASVTWKVNQDNDLVFDSEHPPIVAGSFQSEIGGTDWDQTSTTTRMVDDGTGGDVTAGDDIYTYQVIIPAGSYECKVVLNNNWDQDTGNNLPFDSDGTTASTFTYDMSNNTTTVPSGGLSQDVTVTFQIYLGNLDSLWYNNGVSVQGNVAPLNWISGSNLMSDPDSNLIYTADIVFYAGSAYNVEYKFTRCNNESIWSWEDAIDNRQFTIDDSDSTQILNWVYWDDIVPVPQNATISVVGQDVNLSWDAIFGATDYEVLRSSDPYSGFTHLANTGGATTYQDSGAGGKYRAEKYFYQISAIH